MMHGHGFAVILQLDTATFLRFLNLILILE